MKADKMIELIKRRRLKLILKEIYRRGGRLEIRPGRHILPWHKKQIYSQGIRINDELKATLLSLGYRVRLRTVKLPSKYFARETTETIFGIFKIKKQSLVPHFEEFQVGYIDSKPKTGLPPEVLNEITKEVRALMRNKFNETKTTKKTR